MPENRGEGRWREGGEQGGKEWEAEYQHHDKEEAKHPWLCTAEGKGERRCRHGNEAGISSDVIQVLVLVPHTSYWSLICGISMSACQQRTLPSAGVSPCRELTSKVRPIRSTKMCFTIAVRSSDQRASESRRALRTHLTRQAYIISLGWEGQPGGFQEMAWAYSQREAQIPEIFS